MLPLPFLLLLLPFSLSLPQVPPTSSRSLESTYVPPLPQPQSTGDLHPTLLLPGIGGSIVQGQNKTTLKTHRIWLNTIGGGIRLNYWSFGENSRWDFRFILFTAQKSAYDGLTSFWDEDTLSSINMNYETVPRSFPSHPFMLNILLTFIHWFTHTTPGEHHNSFGQLRPVCHRRSRPHQPPGVV